jgi:hypothetical protein
MSDEGSFPASRYVRAFAWMRWRVLMNTLERSLPRDRLERFSRAIEYLGPLIVGLMLVPSAIGLGALGLVAGASIRGEFLPRLLVVVRVLLMALTVAVVLTPLLFPAGRQIAGFRRLLLLPIPRRALFSTEILGGVTDPWVAVTLPMILLLPAGVAYAAGPVAALAATLGSLLLIAFFLGAAAAVSLLVHLITRDRRRGELFALALMIAFSVLAVVPALIEEPRERRAPGAPRTRQSRPLPGWIRLAPPELAYAGAARAAGAVPGSPATPLALLAVMTLAVHGVAWTIFNRVVDSPASIGPGRRSTSPARVRRLRGLSPGAAAVAIAQLKLMSRSPRGRMVLFGPLLLVAVFSAIAMRGDVARSPFPFLDPSNGVGVATACALLSIVSLHPLMLNQFAIDGAGLTLEFLAPVTDLDLIVGKAASGALVVLGCLILSYGVPLLLFPGGDPRLWMASLLGAIATYAITVPMMAYMSIVFPKVVDLNVLGRRSNPHAMASLAGLAGTALAAAPAFALAFAATALLRRPGLTVPLMTIWLIAAILIGSILLKPAARTLAFRRENLAIIAEGR